MNTNIDIEPKKLDIVATGQRIKLLMDEKGIAIKDLSKFMDVSFQAVYRWQKGDALPTISNLFILGQILDIDVDDILVAKEKE